MQHTTSPPGNVRMVVLDVGGVIAGNLHWYREIEKLLPSSHQMELIEKERQIQWNKIKVDESISVETFWETILSAGGLQGKISWQQLDNSFREQFMIFPSVVLLIQTLHSRGYTVGVISNHARSWFDEIFDKFRLWDLFPNKDLIIVSCATRSAKPSPEIFQTAEKEFKKVHPNLQPNEIVFVGKNSLLCLPTLLFLSLPYHFSFLSTFSKVFFFFKIYFDFIKMINSKTRMHVRN